MDFKDNGVNGSHIADRLASEQIGIKEMAALESKVNGVNGSHIATRLASEQIGIKEMAALESKVNGVNGSHIATRLASEQIGIKEMAALESKVNGVNDSHIADRLDNEQIGIKETAALKCKVNGVNGSQIADRLDNEQIGIKETAALECKVNGVNGSQIADRLDDEQIGIKATAALESKVNGVNGSQIADRLDNEQIGIKETVALESKVNGVNGSHIADRLDNEQNGIKETAALEPKVNGLNGSNIADRLDSELNRIKETAATKVISVNGSDIAIRLDSEQNGIKETAAMKTKVNDVKGSHVADRLDNEKNEKGTAALVSRVNGTNGLHIADRLDNERNDKKTAALEFHVNGVNGSHIADRLDNEQEEDEIADYQKYISARSSRRESMIARDMAQRASISGRHFVSLALGMPDEEVFPFNSIDVKLKDGTSIELSGAKLKTALQYTPSNGLPSLIKILKNFQTEIHKVRMDGRDIIMTCGSQDGLYKCIEMLLNDGDPVLVQSPTYSGAFCVLKPFNPDVIAVPEDGDGMIPTLLEDILSKRISEGSKMPKVMYVTPTGSNPTGSLITNERREKIYNIACKYDFIILEDDPYYFMNFAHDFPKSFLSLDTEGRVLRFDSISKVISSGMRLGWVTGPKHLIEVLELHMQASFLHSSTLPQVILEELFNVWGMEGMLAHFKTVREVYNKKKNVLKSALERRLTGLAEWYDPKAGMFYWIKVKGVEDVYDMIVNKAFERGLMFVPGHAFAFDESVASPYIRLGFGRASEEDIDFAVKHLAELIKEEQAKVRSCQCWIEQEPGL